MRLRWLGYIQRMQEKKCRNIQSIYITGVKKKGRPRKGGLQHVEYRMWDKWGQEVGNARHKEYKSEEKLWRRPRNTKNYRSNKENEEEKGSSITHKYDPDF